MKKKVLKKIVTASYSKKNELDKEQVDIISGYLTRRELRDYIRALKQIEKKKHLFVDMSFSPTPEQEDLLRKQFSGKDVVFQVDQDLLLGVRITDNDIVYDMNLQRTLDAIEEFIEQQYD